MHFQVPPAPNKNQPKHSFLAQLQRVGIALVCSVGVLSQASCAQPDPPCSATLVSAGADILGRPLGATVMLEAFIRDCDGGLQADWAFLSVPPGSAFTVGSADFTGAHASLPGVDGAGGHTFLGSFVCDVPGEYLLELHGGGGYGEGTDELLVSCTDEVTSQAVCGDDYSIVLGQGAALDGSDSAVLVGEEIEYAWSLISKPADSALADEIAAIAQPSFIPDVSGEYEAQLRVRGNSEDDLSAPCSTLVQVGLEAPTAVITSSDASVSICTAGTSFDLSADLSTSPGDLVLSYEWTLIQKPSGSLADGSNFGTPTAETTTFTPDLFGDYEVGLQVTGVGGTSALVTSLLEAQEGGQPPIVSAGQNQSVDMEVVCIISDLGTPICDPCMGPFALAGVVTSNDNDEIDVRWSGEGVTAGATFNPSNVAETSASVLPRYPAANGDPITYSLPFTLEASDCGAVAADTVTVELTCSGSFGDLN